MINRRSFIATLIAIPLAGIRKRPIIKTRVNPDFTKRFESDKKLYARFSYTINNDSNMYQPQRRFGIS